MGIPSDSGARSIRLCVQDSLDIARRMRYRPQEDRERAATSENPGFAASHPRLLSMCCSATTREEAARVVQFVDMMLSGMASIGSGRETFETASAAVGKVLGDAYIPASASAADAHSAAAAAAATVTPDGRPRDA